jgi:O-antigen/teichoic acid export membrane protein
MKTAMIHYAGYLLSAIGAVCGVSLLSYYVSPDQYGRVALYIAFGTLFQFVVRESLSAAILRYSKVIQEDKHVCLQLAGQAFYKLLMVFILVAVVMVAYLQQSDWQELTMGFFLVALLGFTAAGEAFLSAIFKRASCAIHVNLLQWLRFLLAAIFYVYIEQSVFAILAGFSAGFLITAVFDVVIYYKEKPATSNASSASLLDNIFAGNGPIIIGMLAWFLMFYERIALEWFHGEAYLGAYFVLYQIGFMPVVMVMRSAVTYVFPKLFIDGAVDVKHLNKRNLVLVLGVIVCAFIALQGLHTWLFSWLVGAEYRSYSWLLPWLFLAAMLNACSYMLQAYYYESESIKHLLSIKTKAAMACFVLVSLSVWQFAIEGLIAASVLVSILLIAMSYRAIKK